LGLLPALIVAGVAASNISVATVRHKAPDWRTSVIAARQQCRTPEQVVNVDVAPLDGTWFAAIPCRRLRP
jgi:hypothetical protein